jgi:hypothetical protein
VTRYDYRGIEIGPLTPGEQVTVVRHQPTRFLRGRVDERGLVDTGDGLVGFTVELEDFYPHTGDSAARFHNIWCLDSERATEGLGWCRGWSGPAVEALKVAHALT